MTQEDVIKLLKPSMKTKEVLDLIDEMLISTIWTLDDWALDSWNDLTPEIIVGQIEFIVSLEEETA
jgi:hypothetical protein